MNLVEFYKNFTASLANTLKIYDYGAAYVTDEQKIKELEEQGVSLHKDLTGTYYIRNTLANEDCERLMRISVVKNINTIKNCVLYFTVLSAISILLILINFLVSFNAY